MANRKSCVISEAHLKEGRSGDKRYRKFNFKEISVIPFIRQAAEIFKAYITAGCRDRGKGRKGKSSFRCEYLGCLYKALRKAQEPFSVWTLLWLPGGSYFVITAAPSLPLQWPFSEDHLPRNLKMDGKTVVNDNIVKCYSLNVGEKGRACWLWDRERSAWGPELRKREEIYAELSLPASSWGLVSLLSSNL